MWRFLLSVMVVWALLLGGAAQAQLFDITQPGDPVVGVPDDGNWPAAEIPPYAIDDEVGVKYLCFKTSFIPDQDGYSGLRVTPSQNQYVITALNFATANDAEARDPIAFTLLGSNVSIDGPYVEIASGTIDELSGDTALARNTWISAPIVIDNNKVYMHYELRFTELRDRAAANSMQIGEIEFMTDGSTGGTATEPSPADEATDIMRDVVLGWEAGSYAASHDVYFGTSFDDVNAASRANDLGVLVSQGQAAVSYDPDGLLEFGQTYYWRVDEVNAAPDNTIFKGDVWSFTAELFAYPIQNITASSNAPSDPGVGPENTINGSGLNDLDQHSTDSAAMWLAIPTTADPVYIQYEFDSVYKLHEMLVWNYNVQFELLLGFGLQNVTIEYSENGTDWTALGDVELTQATARADYAANTTVDFGGVPAKFVRLTVNSGYGMLPQYGLSEVRFLSIPAQAREPQPADGAADVSVATALDWRAGREAVSHEVYLGTDAEALAQVDAGAATSYTPAPLNMATTYYWRVDEVNEADEISVWPGKVWSFMTQEFIVVDDFESYTDDEGSRIYESWEDGWVNDTGSTVGYFESPFAEQDTVNSGSQSMPLYYDNSNASTSEATLALNQNWTVSGIQSLSLYFYGNADNTGGQLYVKINGTKIAYDGDAADLARPAWQPWNIDLSAAGNVSNVTSLTIGIEGASADGLLFIDDVRLYPKKPEYITPVEPDAAGLVAQYKLDGNADDSSGNGNNGTLEGGVQFGAGVDGSALDCDGTDDFVSTGKVASDLGIAGNAPRTITVWVYTRGFANGGIYDVGARTTAQDFCLRTLDSIENRWRIQYWGGDLDFSYDTADKWVHFAHVHDGTNTKIYANGVLIVDWEKTIDTTDTNPFQIGQYGWPGNYFDGLIDDLHLYNRALSAEEVLGAAGQTLPRHKPL